MGKQLQRTGGGARPAGRSGPAPAPNNADSGLVAPRAMLAAA